MPRQVDILIIDDEEVLTKSLQRLCRQEGYTSAVAKNAREAMQFLSQNHASVALLDVYLPDLNGFEILDHIHSHCHATETIVMTGKGNIEDSVKALKKGACDYLTKPFEHLEIVSACLKQALEKSHLKKKISSLERQGQDSMTYEGLVGQSKVMQEVYQTLQNVSSSHSSVLILGESGTGKELVARAIHQHSPRKEKPFVVINCSAIPETLMESELFGHVRGAFTGASQEKRGLFEEANGGTVFLDEIGEISLAIQVKLLRVLQEREIRKVGGEATKSVDVRIIAATHQNLSQLIEQEKFREDLYYRLNVISLTIPPLRERTEDIPQLVQFFLKKLSQKTGKQVEEISLDALQALKNYTWPGNVRELENIMERSIVLSEGPIIHAKNLPAKLVSNAFYFSHKEDTDLSLLDYKDAKQKALDLFHKAYLGDLLEQSAGNITVASARAGLDRSNFKKVLRKYRIDSHAFKHSQKPRD